MKRIVMVVLVILALSISLTSPVFAHDKVRGEKGEGDVNQEWINLVSPWAP
ncbi:hypothetical protein ACFLYR_02350 [Chloroflexota bacterium]